MSVHSCPNCGAAMAGEAGPLEAELAQARKALRTSRTEEAYRAVCKERDEWKERREKAEAIKKEGER